MIIKTILSVTIFCLTSCSSSIYKIVGDEYKPLVTESHSKKFIFVSNSNVKNARIFIKLINSRKWHFLDKGIDSLENIKTRKFLQSIELMTQAKYQIAYSTLNNLEETDFDCEVKILKADCLYELKVDSINYLKKYQEAVDCTSNEKIKAIAVKRHRFIKYGI